MTGSFLGMLWTASTPCKTAVYSFGAAERSSICRAAEHIPHRITFAPWRQGICTCGDHKLAQVSSDICFCAHRRSQKKELYRGFIVQLLTRYCTAACRSSQTYACQWRCRNASSAALCPTCMCTVSGSCSKRMHSACKARRRRQRSRVGSASPHEYRGITLPPRNQTRRSQTRNTCARAQRGCGQQHSRRGAATVIKPSIIQP